MNLLWHLVGCLQFSYTKHRKPITERFWISLKGVTSSYLHIGLFLAGPPQWAYICNSASQTQVFYRPYSNSTGWNHTVRMLSVIRQLNSVTWQSTCQNESFSQITARTDSKSEKYMENWQTFQELYVRDKQHTAVRLGWTDCHRFVSLIWQ